MPPTRQGVGQHVVRAVDEAHFVVVAVVALVEACQPTQVGGAHVGGNGALVVSGDGWGVVAQSGNSPLAHIEFLCDDLRLGQDARLFQITVSDVAGRVVVRDQAALNVGWKGSSPEDGVVVGSERDTTHAGMTRVNGPQKNGSVGDDFAQASGAVHEALGEAFEVVKMVRDVASDADAVLVRVLES